MATFENMVGERLIKRFDACNNPEGISAVVRSIIEIGQEIGNVDASITMLTTIYNYQPREQDLRSWVRQYSAVDDALFESKLEVIKNVQ